MGNGSSTAEGGVTLHYCAVKSTGNRISVVRDSAISDWQEDRFAHGPVAERLADLLISEPEPLAIGLFGPWGSGKSSVLHLASHSLRNAGAGLAVVEIDAWRYSEAPLSRQFVSQTARQLEEQRPDGALSIGRQARRRRRSRVAQRRTRAALYESRRSRRIQVRRGLTGLGAAAVVVGVFAAVTAAALWLETIAAETAWQVSLHQILSRWGAIVPLLLGAGAVITLLTTEADTTRPGSQEEFEAALRGELDHHPWCKRVVFLVDELDRAGPAEVLSTLNTIRSFMAVERCSFVVAVDRNLLEAALSAEPMNWTATQNASTYTGLSGSMLDKLFSVQIDMPTIRPRRLGRFGLQLATQQGGVWTNDPSLPLEEIVGVLVAPHVRSPRRVKVLLNAYSAALVTARARHSENPGEVPDVAGREVPLAVLTCIRTEFPLLAADLNQDPDLLHVLHRLALDLPLPDAFNELTLRRAHEIADGLRAVETALPVMHAPGPVDESSNASSDEQAEQVDAVGRTGQGEDRRDELMTSLRLLDSTALPGRELIFGQSLGDLFGLSPDAADLVETAALRGDAPKVDASDGQMLAVTASTCRYVLSMCTTEIGAPRRRSLEALGKLLEASPQLDDPDVHTGVTAVAQDWATEFSEESPAQRLFAVARYSRGTLDNELIRVLADVDLLASTPELIADSTWWPPDVAAAARPAFAASLSSNATETLDRLSELEPSARSALWSDDAWLALVADTDDREIRDAAVAMATDRPLLWRAFRILVSDTPGYALALVDGIGGPADDSETAVFLGAAISGEIPPSLWQRAANVLSDPADAHTTSVVLDELLRLMSAEVAADPDLLSSAESLCAGVSIYDTKAIEDVEDLVTPASDVRSARALAALYTNWDVQFGLGPGTAVARRRNLSTLTLDDLTADDHSWLENELVLVTRGSEESWGPTVVARIRPLVDAEVGIRLEASVYALQRAPFRPEFLDEISPGDSPARVRALTLWLVVRR